MLLSDMIRSPVNMDDIISLCGIKTVMNRHDETIPIKHRDFFAMGAVFPFIPMYHESE